MCCQSKLAIGLMSGTSMDGIDAAIVSIAEDGNEVDARLIEFEWYPFPKELKEELLLMAGGNYGGTRDICLMQEKLGRLYARAAVKVCGKAGISTSEIDFVGCHGQTLWHQPVSTLYLGEEIRGTLQIGDPSFINEELGCPVVSDFRLRDMAAGGQGAPIVPYTEFLLYRGKEDVALLNIGGISNITIIPANCHMEDVLAFDTGPGNVLIDRVVRDYTNGAASYDEGGRIAMSGNVNDGLLRHLLADDYLYRKPPKSTGREHYDDSFINDLLSFCNTEKIEYKDVIATLARYTAECVYLNVKEFAPIFPGKLIVSGGGAHNEAIMQKLRHLFEGCKVLKAEEAGINPDAKEAVAMALLANETLKGKSNNVPSVTGAHHPVVMGRVSY